ncbi:hypothetical protein [Clostridium butyricum]
MNKCPRCSNENLNEGYKYCPICGLKLGTALEVPVQEQPFNKTQIAITFVFLVIGYIIAKIIFK